MVCGICSRSQVHSLRRIEISSTRSLNLSASFIRFVSVSFSFGDGAAAPFQGPRMAGSGLSFFLFCGGGEEVVQDQAIPRAVGVEVQVCRRITNTVGGIFRVVAGVEGGGALAIISVARVYLFIPERRS